MIALIPARGGSKGLPNKNIKWLVDKPLIAHTILEAQRAKFVSRVIVSTDDEEIAKVAREYGAETPVMRPAHLATDTALAIDTYRFMIKYLQEGTEELDSIIILQPTSPLRTYADIDNAVQLFIDRKADSVISMCEANYPISWNKVVEDDGKVLNIDSSFLKNRQDEQSTSIPNGSIYIFRSEFILNNDNYYSNKTFAYLMPSERSVDIDTLFDFKFAEFLLSRR